MVVIKSRIVKTCSSLLFTIVVACVLPVLTFAKDPDGSDLPNKYVDMTPFYWTIGIIGGCISITLIYVSWKKYKGERHDRRKDQNR